MNLTSCCPEYYSHGGVGKEYINFEARAEYTSYGAQVFRRQFVLSLLDLIIDAQYCIFYFDQVVIELDLVNAAAVAMASV